MSCTCIYTASGSFVTPNFVSPLKIEVWGAGAGGGAQCITSDGAGGGGGGAYARVDAYIAPSGQTYCITIGVGGAGGASCTTYTALAKGQGCCGTGTYFCCTATMIACAAGGRGGLASTGTPPNGPAGGTTAASLGDTTLAGGFGEKGRNNATGCGGFGGSSAGCAAAGFCTGGATAWSTITFPVASAPTCSGIGGNGGIICANGVTPASGYGGGGGGTGRWFTGGNLSGGAGKPGEAKVTYCITGSSGYYIDNFDSYTVTGTLLENTASWGSKRCSLCIINTASNSCVATYVATNHSSDFNYGIVSNNQFSQIQIGCAGTSQIGTSIRNSGKGLINYYYIYGAGTGSAYSCGQFGKIVNGTDTIIGYPSFSAIVTNDVIKIFAIGNSIYTSLNGTAYCYGDVTFSTGYTGIAGYTAAGCVNSSANCWIGGNICSCSIYTDSFDIYPNGTKLGCQPYWITNNYSMYVVNPTGSAGAIGTTCINGYEGGMAYMGGTFNNDQYSEVIIGNLTANYAIGPAVRMIIDTSTYYGWYGAATESYLFLMTGSSYCNFFTGNAFSAGDRLKLEVVGNELRAYKNGVLDTSINANGKYTVPAGLRITSGHAGLTAYNNATNGVYNCTSVCCWTGGNYVAPTTTTTTTAAPTTTTTTTAAPAGAFKAKIIII
jgi:hypothetical protein